MFILLWYNVCRIRADILLSVIIDIHPKLDIIVFEDKLDVISKCHWFWIAWIDLWVNECYANSAFILFVVIKMFCYIVIAAAGKSFQSKKMNIFQVYVIQGNGQKVRNTQPNYCGSSKQGKHSKLQGGAVRWLAREHIASSVHGIRSYQKHLVCNSSQHKYLHFQQF